MHYTVQNKTSLITAGVVTASLLLTMLSGDLVFASSTNSNRHTPVTICHATGSNSNPYVKETVDDDAVDGNGNGNADHNRNDHQHGEDIIPPGTWDADGRNWNTQGQATWNNNCTVSSVTNTPTPTPTGTVGNTSTTSSTPTNTPTPTSGGSTNTNVSTNTSSSEPAKTVESIQLALSDSKMANTGTFPEAIMNIMFGLGSLTTGLGFLSYKKQK
jgi:hypothetical protein